MIALPGPMRSLLDGGGVILTANARAARALHRHYAQLRSAEGATTWQTPQVLDLHSWLHEQWQQLLLTGAEDRLLLNQVQEQQLWQRILAPELRPFLLVAPDRMAALAQQGYALLAAYGALGWLEGRAAPLADNPTESERFQQWARRFRAACARRRWLPASELPVAIAEALRRQSIEAPPRIGWLGFDRLTPADDALRGALDAQGCQQESLAWELDAAPPLLHAARGEADELQACAQWVRARLQTSPEARIGILLPDLGTRRAALERELFRVLSPVRPPVSFSAEPSLPFEFSLGQPLAQVPLVRAALLLLRWLARPLPQHDITWLLLSGTLGAASEEAGRAALAQWDAKLRRGPSAPPELSLDALLRLQFPAQAAARALYESLQRMRLAWRAFSSTASPGAWVQRVTHLLDLAGWGRHTTASSLHFQARDAFDTLLNAIASLDFDRQALSFEELLATLERVAAETLFAAESNDAPVQVMGAYAASGQWFDAVWFLGASDIAWPASGRIHPLLPVALQRELEMPHASTAADEALGHRTTQRILASTREAVFSYARQLLEEVQRPSALTAAFAPFAVTYANEFPDPPQLDPLELDTVPDDAWVPLDPASTGRGGQGILQAQAACPFRSFVVNRLAARALSIAGRGLSPMDRGIVLHRAMETLWSQSIEDLPSLTGQAGLKSAIAGGQLQRLANAHAAAAMRELKADRSADWQLAYLAAEQQRLASLLEEWLLYEATREEFTVIATERPIAIHVGELAVKVRVDRIDAVSGGHIVLDYKTGKVDVKGWDGVRPEQPQLPLYAAFAPAADTAQTPVGALFAQVRPRELAFKGRLADARASLLRSLDDKDKNVQSTYTLEMVEEWRSVLLSLAEAFLRGEAQIDPRDFPKTCKLCDLQGLCRVAETRLAGIAALEDEDGDAEEDAQP